MVAFGNLFFSEIAQEAQRHFAADADRKRQDDVGGDSVGPAKPRGREAVAEQAHRFHHHRPPERSPRKHACDQQPIVGQNGAVGFDAEGGEDRQERQHRNRVRDGEEKRRGEIAD